MMTITTMTTIMMKMKMEVPMTKLTNQTYFLLIIVKLAF